MWPQLVICLIILLLLIHLIDLPSGRKNCSLYLNFDNSINSLSICINRCHLKPFGPSLSRLWHVSLKGK